MIIIFLTSFFIFSSIFSLLYYRITGYIARNYRVLSFVQIDRKELSLIDQFKPLVYQSNDLKGPSPSKILYEIIPGQGGKTIVYRVEWKTEVHPNPVINVIYNIFRFCFYGSPVDYEYFQITLNSMDDIIEMRYETEPNHTQVLYKRTFTKSEAFNDIWKLFLNSKEVAANKVVTFLNQHRFTLKTLTWNHVFAVDQVIEGLEEYDLPLVIMNDDFYKNMKMSRRSWGDFGTYVNRSGEIKKGFILGLILSFSVHFISLIYLL